MSHKHASHLQGKFWQDREILHAVDFPANGTFQAFYSSEKHLKELGYCVGSMCRQEPIGFAYGAECVAKWYNLDSRDKAQLDGVILPQPDFREGGAIILFFTPPKY
jgi:hypothetical protein